jgi:transcription-repair coupling factor (superfamily II helicase)
LNFNNRLFAEASLVSSFKSAAKPGAKRLTSFSKSHKFFKLRICLENIRPRINHQAVITIPNYEALAWQLVYNYQTNKRPIFLLLPNNKQISQLSTLLKFFHPTIPCLEFPDGETLAYDRLSPPADTTARRLLTLTQLLSCQQGIILASTTAALQRIAPRSYIAAQAFQFSINEPLDSELLKIRLIQSGYHRVAQIQSAGEFTVRGSIIDVFPIGSHKPFRLDTDADKVDSLRYFNPATQKSEISCETIQILPAKEFPLSHEAIQLFQKKWQTQFGERAVNSAVYQQLTLASYPAGIEYYLPLFFENPHCLFDYLPPNTDYIALDTARQQAQTIWQNIQQRYEAFRHDINWPLLPPEQLYQTPDALEEKLQINNCTRAGIEQNLAPHTECPTPFRSLPGIQSDPLPIKTLLSNHFSNYKLLFCATSASLRAGLCEKLQTADIFPRVCKTWEDFLQDATPYQLIQTPITAGFILKEARIALLPAAYLLNNPSTPKTSPKQALQETHAAAAVDQLSHQHLSALQIGGYAVHKNHGIGRYLGLKLIQSAEQATEFITLEYAESAKLYVPITDIQLITPYKGQTNPPLDNLHSDRWQKLKQKTLVQLRDVAAELLDAYAQRASQKGFAYPKPDAAYQTFISGFGFQETPDQSAAIEAVLADLCSTQPMDRLLCGDVGFGKTEVAMRAAFIAAKTGKQVAILTPTTLLAEQHYRNFQDRFAAWPIHVACLSRFRTTAKANTIRLALAQGQIAIIIGTHALLSKHIAFKNLGLLIIDEEHHFGVQQKERLKSLKRNVDTLTLTATPIPRTLQMALAGLRKLSILATPPAGRLPIKSFFSKRCPNLIREAILRELLRGGQVYFVHNHIQTLPQLVEEITALVPEARIAIAHGQLPEQTLEERMTDFCQQRVNILICTAIVETGLDIPTANTLIVDQADHFGLAQLHQLRGRVGRARYQAYAYFLIADTAATTADAKKRLEALQAFSALGAGFTLATQDLDIRGAGELLGEKQSGTLKGIGLALYLELLDQTIEALKKGQSLSHSLETSPLPSIDLALPALLPPDYLADVAERLHYYKRIAQASDAQAVELLQMELIDRYGLLPIAARNLFDLTALKWTAKHLGITQISAGPRGGKIGFTEQPNIQLSTLIQLIQAHPQHYQLKKSPLQQNSQQLYFKWEILESEQYIPAIKQLLTRLATDVT